MEQKQSYLTAGRHAFPQSRLIRLPLDCRRSDGDASLLASISSSTGQPTGRLRREPLTRSQRVYFTNGARACPVRQYFYPRAMPDTLCTTLTCLLSDAVFTLSTSMSRSCTRLITFAGHCCHLQAGYTLGLLQKRLHPPCICIARLATAHLHHTPYIRFSPFDSAT